MRLPVGILILAMAASAWAQIPILDNTRNKLKSATEKNLPRNALKDRNGSGAAPAKVTPYSSAPGRGTAISKSAKSVAHRDLGNKPVRAQAKPHPETAPPPAVAANKNDDTGADLPDSMSDVAKKLATTHRDPFLSPVVTHIENTGCTTGKRCLTPGQVSLKGVVRSQEGMIAVVVNSMNKAYFLHENDPIFNGYVLRITGDSIVFKETFQDNLGHPRTREVVKKISTPAV